MGLFKSVKRWTQFSPFVTLNDKYFFCTNIISSSILTIGELLIMVAIGKKLVPVDHKSDDKNSILLLTNLNSGAFLI